MQAANRLNLPLARVPLFRGLDDATIDDILSCMQARRYAAGELFAAKANRAIVCFYCVAAWRRLSC
jgi:hypothetical protein